MKIVILSEYASRELVVVEHVIKHFPDTVVVQPDYSNTVEKKKSQKHKGIPSFQNLLNRLTWKLHRELWDRKLYPGKSFPKLPNTTFIPANQLNRKEGIQTIKKLEPDILITCRAPILKPEIIKIPRIAAINVHYGLAPYYRGNDTLFWPLYYKDYERLGGCIHYLTEGIDTGNIIAEVYPDLNSRDGEISVDIKTTRLLAQAVVKFLKAAENKKADLTGKQQNEKGRNFNSKDRTFKHSLSYLLKRAAFLSRPPSRKSRILTYF